MTSMQSDTESNVSGFIRYSDENYKDLYTSMIQGMKKIHNDLHVIEKNLKDVIKQAGPMESQLKVLLLSLPQQNLPMQTD